MSLGFSEVISIFDEGSLHALVNPEPIGTNEAYTLDNTRPNISSIALLNPRDPLTNADSVQFRVTFDAPLQGITLDDFVVSGDAARVTSRQRSTQRTMQRPRSAGLFDRSRLR